MKIKILTLNIWGGELLESVIDFINKENPDIVLLQEVYNGLQKSQSPKLISLSVLARDLNFPHYAFEPFLIDSYFKDKVLQGNAIFSRFPLRNQKAIFFDIPFGEFNLENGKTTEKSPFVPVGLLGTLIRVGDLDINTYSAHGIWGFDGKDSPRRIAMSQIIVDEIRNKENVILAGDFNLDPGTKTIDNIEKHLSSVFGEELVSTFNMKHKDLPGYATAAVDMIFVSKNFKIINRYMPDVDVSDHMPLVAELEI